MAACLAVANDASSALNMDAFYAMQSLTGYPGQIGDYDECAKVSRGGHCSSELERVRYFVLPICAGLHCRARSSSGGDERQEVASCHVAAMSVSYAW